MNVAAVGATGTGSAPCKLTAELIRWFGRLSDDCRYFNLLISQDKFIKEFETTLDTIVELCIVTGSGGEDGGIASSRIVGKLDVEDLIELLVGMFMTLGIL